MKNLPEVNPFWTFALWVGAWANRIVDWPKRRRVRKQFPDLSDEGVTKRLELEASSERTAQYMVNALNFFSTREELQWDVETERLRFPPGCGPVAKKAQKLFEEYVAEKKRQSTIRFRLRKLFNWAAAWPRRWLGGNEELTQAQQARIQRFKNRVEQAIRLGTVTREMPNPDESRRR